MPGTLAKYQSGDSRRLRVRAATWVVRMAVGATFLFSGFVKAIDPWGTLYKVNDYLAVLGLDLWSNLVLAGVFLLCGIEFLTGFLLCFGCLRRSSPLLALAIMVFMLPLSLWIAVSNPVADCGCFGDALIISNWATFWKNVALTAGVLWLVRYNRRISWLITPALQWIAIVATSLFILLISLLGYEYQPLLDFRPYPVGGPLIEPESDTDVKYVFVYEKDGVKKEFSETDDLPDEDSGWQFVDTREVRASELADPKENPLHRKDFHIWDKEGEEDVTEEVLTPVGDRLMLLMPDLNNVSSTQTWKINSLYTWASQHDIDMIAVVSGSADAIAEWEDLSMPEYEIYTADDTAIKSVARGNPAIVFTRNGVVEWKSTLTSIDVDDFLAPDTSVDPMSFGRDNRAILINLTLLYLAVTALLIALSFSTKLARFLPNKMKEEVKNDSIRARNEREEELHAGHPDDKKQP